MSTRIPKIATGVWADPVVSLTYQLNDEWLRDPTSTVADIVRKTMRSTLDAVCQRFEVDLESVSSIMNDYQAVLYPSIPSTAPASALENLPPEGLFVFMHPILPTLQRGMLLDQILESRQKRDGLEETVQQLKKQVDGMLGLFPPKPSAKPRPDTSKGDNGGMLEMKQFLSDELAKVNKKLDDKDEELKTVNKKLEDKDEELITFKEELKTVKEELKTVKEELKTVKGALAAQVAETLRLTKAINPLRLRVLLERSCKKILQHLQLHSWWQITDGRNEQEQVEFIWNGLANDPSRPFRATLTFLCSQNGVREDGNVAAHTAEEEDIATAVMSKDPGSNERKHVEGLYKFVYGESQSM